MPIIPRRWRTLLWFIPFWQPLTDRWAKTTNWPILGKCLGFILNKDHYDVTFIPINKELEDNGSTVLPKQVVQEMIRKSCHRIIIPVCLCRMGCRCEDYPLEIGCIFLGESTRGVDPSLGKAVSEEEALAHLDRAIEAGLIPQIGRVDPDPFMLGVDPRQWDRFLTLCFCCTCCCIAMRNMSSWSQDVRDRMHRLEGLDIQVTDKCNGCSKCAVSCFAHAIQIRDKRAHISDACKGCGICADICPEKAIEITVRDGDRMLEQAHNRISRYADIT